MERFMFNHRALFVLVLGDSAPYGAHIPTDVYLGEMAVSLGFRLPALQARETRPRLGTT